jgi:hypothetical protein
MRERLLGLRAKAALAGAFLAGAFAATPAIAHAQFGIASFSSSLSSTQAGAHADYTASFALSTEALGNPQGLLRGTRVTLPAGLVGNPLAIERCSTEAFEKIECKPTSQVGTLTLVGVGCRGVSSPLQAEAEAGSTTITVAAAHAFCSEQDDNSITIGEGAAAETATVERVVNATTLELEAPLEHPHATGEGVTHVASPVSETIPLFNLQPSPGHVATFAASQLLAGVLVQVGVGEDGRLVAMIEEVSSLVSIEGSTLTLWGVPAAASHDPQRCEEYNYICNQKGGEPAAFMTNPTACGATGPSSELSVTSWQGQSASSTASLPALGGCEQLALEPTMTVSPSTSRRDSPAGYEIAVSVRQQEAPYDLATPALKSVAVTLPQGVSLSPGLANGLQACEAAQLERDECPDASRVGSAEVLSPMLAEAVYGSIYLGTPAPGERFRLFLRLHVGASAVSVFGHVVPDERSGRVSAVFEDMPELPFARFVLDFFGGPGAALANPPGCGPAVSEAQFDSYGGQQASARSAFDLDEDVAGGTCPAAEPFAPGFVAGVTDARAGHASPFTLTLSRADGQQYLSTFSAQLPPGLVGLVGDVARCPEPAAAAGACAQASQVGEATIAAGAGPLPLELSGPVYLTGPYDGAPLGLDIVVDANVGPFELGSVLVRVRVTVDPRTLAIAIASDPLPQTLDGIPLRMRTVNVDLDRAGFMVDPTSCSREAIAATAQSQEGAVATLSEPFMVSGCAALSFAPRLRASTAVPASEQGQGAGLDVEVANPSGPQSAVSSVRIQMPRQLRPRLTTIQHACAAAQLAAVFACPADAIVGHATVASPATVAALAGPVYLVAHGGSALPSLVMLLRGEGIEAQLEGTMSISASGAITAAFANLPDVPVSSLDIALPRGANSMLGAVASLCAKPLSLPYVLVDHGGVSVKGTARVAVGGCAHRATAARRRRRGARSRSSRATRSRRRA